MPLEPVMGKIIFMGQDPKFYVFITVLLYSNILNFLFNFQIHFYFIDFTSGTTKDWVYDGLGVIHGYTLELRNTNDGFITPTSLIAPVATEAWNGLKAMANAIRVWIFLKEKW